MKIQQIKNEADRQGRWFLEVAKENGFTFSIDHVDIIDYSWNSGIEIRASLFDSEEYKNLPQTIKDYMGPTYVSINRHFSRGESEKNGWYFYTGKKNDEGRKVEEKT